MEKWKTRSIKAEANEIVNKRGVQKNRIALFILIIPTIISIMLFSEFGSIGSLILEFIEAIIITVLTLAIKDIIYKGEAKAKFQFNYSIFSAIITYQFVGWLIMLLGGILGESFIMFILQLLLLFIWSILYFSVQYVIAFKEVSYDKGLKIGLLIGYNYFWKILKLQLSFIPLYILCIITFGIVFIFKATYISTTYGVLVKRILSEININMY